MLHYGRRPMPVFVRRKQLLGIMIICALLSVGAHSQAKQLKCPANSTGPARPLDGETRSVVYRSIDKHDLKLHVFEPPSHKSSDKSAALILFPGGGWSRGSAREFEPHARYLAAKGLVVLIADYRIRCREGTGVAEAISDAEAATDWIRKHGSSLGIDANRLASGGASAGGHIALTAAAFEGEAQTRDAGRGGSHTKALILFSTPVDLTPTSIRSITELDAQRSAELSPINHIHKGMPSILFLHAKDDASVPFSSVDHYCATARAAGNECNVIAYENGGHGFFNASRGKGKVEKDRSPNYYRESLEQVERFLAALGFIGKP